jgi:glucosylceramidase
MHRIKYTLAVFIFLISIQIGNAQSLEYWLTKPDQSVLFEKQIEKISFHKEANDLPKIEVNEAEKYQSIDGFGYTLTGGSAFVINQLPKANRQKLLEELFGKGKKSIGISYLRMSIGSSDLDFSPYTYNDLPPGETDIKLERFNLNDEKHGVVSLLQEIVKINPKLKILGSPWSAPVWMKDNDHFKGGKLQTKYYEVYAEYFVKYVTELKKHGIEVDAVTPQNEPLFGGNNPSMVMTASEQTEFIKNYLGPKFLKAGLKTKIVVYDHNCDNPAYPIEILNDREARKFVDGSAFHLYSGEITALSNVHDAHPDKNVYFTEQYTSTKGSFGGDLNWHVKNLIIGATRNWSKNVLEWNLANDSEFKPYTIGGCDVCKGALMIGKETVTRNVSYYIIAHASKFVTSGSIRIGSTLSGDIQNVAFKTPGGKFVLIAQNDSQNSVRFCIKFKKKRAVASLAAGAVGTFIW